MKEKKRIGMVFAAAALSAGILAGCGRSEGSPENFADVMEAVDDLSQAEQLLQITETGGGGGENE